MDLRLAHHDASWWFNCHIVNRIAVYMRNALVHVDVLPCKASGPYTGLLDTISRLPATARHVTSQISHL